MEAFDHDELTDRELDDLLSKWEIPTPPASLCASVLPKLKQPWWKRALTASIRVPVPVAICLAVIVVLGIWQLTRPQVPRVIVRTERVEVPVPVPVAEKHVVTRVIVRRKPVHRENVLLPVAELRPRIIRSTHEEN